MRIKLEKQPRKYVAKQAPRIRSYILHAVSKIPAGDIRPLKGLPNAYRLRVGKIRVLFRTNELDEAIIFKIDTRGDVYKT